MKTIIIYNPVVEPLKYLIVDGDYSRFNGILVNSCRGTGFEDEFTEWFFDQETGDENFETTTDISLLENKQWDKIAVVTYLP